MKIKSWLLLSYFLVMILPLAAGYALLAWINAYHDDQKVEEYVEVWSQMHGMASVLSDPGLYQPGIERPEVDRLVNPQVSIVLYNRDGLVLYTSDPVHVSTQYALDREELYGNLYSLEQGYRAFRYKEPVFAGSELAGFFEIRLARDAWTGNVALRTWITAGLFMVAFSLIYLGVVVLVNRKLNRPLNRLMKQMTAFARQEPAGEIPAGKDEIGELTRRFMEMRRQIETARANLAREQREKELMIASLSHDLKTPLTSIRAYAESLASEQDLTGEEREEYRNIIVEKANYMKQMLDDLLVYSLLQSPSYQMELVEVDGSEFFDMLLSDYEPLCREKQIHLQVCCDVTGRCRVNPQQMMRVADNLMSNAIRHTNPGGRILLAAVSSGRPLPDGLFPFVRDSVGKYPDGSAFLIVQNEGEGIANETADRLFEPLYQTDRSRSKKDARGTGLGLSIAQQIMEKHGGDIRLVSEEGTGTGVICRLPAIKEGDDVEDRC